MHFLFYEDHQGKLEVQINDYFVKENIIFFILRVSAPQVGSILILLVQLILSKRKFDFRTSRKEINRLKTE